MSRRAAGGALALYVLTSSAAVLGWVITEDRHWMWFAFPQLAGLGRSPTALFYAIASLEEARAYLEHPLLGKRLRQSIDAILPWAGRRSVERIFGPVDAMKLRSSLTLFDRVSPNDLFGRALGVFFAGVPDERTLALLEPKE